LHLALMTGARTVSWFWPNPAMKVWLPVGKRHETVVGRNIPGEQFLRGVDNDELIGAVHAVLDARPDKEIRRTSG
jgi:hypothetical protein